MEPKRESSSRRRFLSRAMALGATTPAILTARARGAGSPNDRINLGFIGVGIMGRGHLRSFLGAEEAQVVAVCDVVAERREHARKTTEDAYAKRGKSGSFKGCAAYDDFRDLLARADVDAVVIATPDHWHAIPVVEAARAGKDIYCEKPLTHTIAQGRAIVEEVRGNRVVFQTGSQQRSEYGNRFRDAVEWVRNGRIGKILTVHVGVGSPPKPCDLPTEPVPAGTDWDRWLGPAAERGYNEILCPKGVHNHYPAWRSYREFGGGGLADMGAHHFDIAQWALGMDNSGPVRVDPPADGADRGLRFTYADGTVMVHGGPSGCTFVGTSGLIHVDRNKLVIFPESAGKAPIPEDGFHVEPSDNHRRNWLGCIRSRKTPICHAEIGHRSATVCHLANIGYELRRSLEWDPKKERFVGDAGADALIDRPMRSPWML